MHVVKNRVMASAVLDAPSGAQKARDFAHGVVHYLERAEDGEELFLNVQASEGKVSNLRVKAHEVKVHDVRPLKEQMSLEKNGFGLYKLEVPKDLNWEDNDEVKRVYYPLVEKLLVEATGASRVHIFDTTLRNGKLSKEELKEFSLNTVQRNGPVPMAHIDYTASSGRDRLDAVLPDEANKLRETPFAVIQVWRPLRGPVQDSPLGMIDASTVDDSNDLTSYTINFPERKGYNYGVHYSDKHKWYFADQMETDEAYVFVCFDSRLDRARFTPHTGFVDLSVGDDAPPRQSIELRSYVFWENEPRQESKD